MEHLTRLLSTSEFPPLQTNPIDNNNNNNNTNELLTLNHSLSNDLFIDLSKTLNHSNTILSNSSNISTTDSSIHSSISDPNLNELNDLNKKIQILANGDIIDCKELPTTARNTLYKTELCKHYNDTGNCRYGTKCQFAHGEDELRGVLRHPKYRTTHCKAYALTGKCMYGTRCRFIHIFDTTLENNLNMNINMKDINENNDKIDTKIDHYDTVHTTKTTTDIINNNNDNTSYITSSNTILNEYPIEIKDINNSTIATNNNNNNKSDVIPLIPVSPTSSCGTTISTSGGSPPLPPTKEINDKETKKKKKSNLTSKSRIFHPATKIINESNTKSNKNILKHSHTVDFSFFSSLNPSINNDNNNNNNTNKSIEQIQYNKNEQNTNDSTSIHLLKSLDLSPLIQPSTKLNTNNNIFETSVFHETIYEMNLKNDIHFPSPVLETINKTTNNNNNIKNQLNDIFINTDNYYNITDYQNINHLNDFNTKNVPITSDINTNTIENDNNNNKSFIFSRSKSNIEDIRSFKNNNNNLFNGINGLNDFATDAEIDAKFSRLSIFQHICKSEDDKENK